MLYKDKHTLYIRYIEVQYRGKVLTQSNIDKHMQFRFKSGLAQNIQIGTTEHIDQNYRITAF